MLRNSPKNSKPDVLIQSQRFLTQVFLKFVYHSKHLCAKYYHFPGPISEDSYSVVEGREQKPVHLTHVSGDSEKPHSKGLQS